MEESGFLVPPIQNWLAILAPANTPRDVVNTLNQIIVKTLTAPDFKGNSLASTSEVSTTFINGEIRKFRSLAATHKITTE
jgi:tripartite-type tricarboxylate transporter receptor subunit TctC